MKKFLALLFALFAPAILSAANFEGRITMKLSGQKGLPPTMVFSLKEGFTRLDMSAEGMRAGVIYDIAKQEITMLMLDQKMYMTQSMAKAAATVAAAAGNKPGETLEVTTAREKILGYDCVKYVSKSKEGTSEIWVTDQLGAFLGFGGPPAGAGGRGPANAAPKPPGWEEAIAGKGVFPLRVITTNAGRESFRLEATAIEKASLPAVLFYPPTDFSNLGEMLRGMGMPADIPGMLGGMKPPGGE